MIIQILKRFFSKKNKIKPEDYWKYSDWRQKGNIENKSLLSFASFNSANIEQRREMAFIISRILSAPDLVFNPAPEKWSNSDTWVATPDGKNKILFNSEYPKTIILEGPLAKPAKAWLILQINALIENKNTIHLNG